MEAPFLTEPSNGGADERAELVSVGFDCTTATVAADVPSPVMSNFHRDSEHRLYVATLCERLHLGVLGRGGTDNQAIRRSRDLCWAGSLSAVSSAAASVRCRFDPRIQN
jgi:hypothetical protein